MATIGETTTSLATASTDRRQPLPRETQLHGPETVEIGAEDFRARFEAEFAKVMAEHKAERRREHEAIGYPTVTWLAVCPRWDLPTAAAVGFPSRGGTVPQIFEELHQAGYGEVRDLRSWDAPEGVQYFAIEKGPQFELLKSLVDEKGEAFVRSQAAEAGRSLLKAGGRLNSYLTRWAEVASRLDHPAEAAEYLLSQVRTSLARRDDRSTAEGGYWLDAVRETGLDLYGGQPMKVAVQAASAELTADYARRKDETKAQIKSNLEAAWASGVSPQVTHWLALFPYRMTAATAVRCGLAANTEDYVATLKTLQDKGVIQRVSEPDDEVHSPLYTEEVVLEQATSTPEGKQALRAEMVRWGQLLSGDKLDDGFNKWATLYARAGHPQETAEFLTSAIERDRAHSWEGQPQRWLVAARAVAMVDGGAMDRNWEAVVDGKT